MLDCVGEEKKVLMLSCFNLSSSSLTPGVPLRKCSILFGAWGRRMKEWTCARLYPLRAGSSSAEEGCGNNCGVIAACQPHNPQENFDCMWTGPDNHSSHLLVVTLLIGGCLLPSGISCQWFLPLKGWEVKWFQLKLICWHNRRMSWAYYAFPFLETLFLHQLPLQWRQWVLPVALQEESPGDGQRDMKSISAVAVWRGKNKPQQETMGVT